MVQCCEVCDIARKLDGEISMGTMMSESKAASDGRRGIFDVDDAWLEGRKEDAIDPELPIVDPHHHLWDRGSRYLLDEFRGDLV